MPVVKQVWNAAPQVNGDDKRWKQISRHGGAPDAPHGTARRRAWQGRAHHRQRRQGALPADAMNRQLRADRPKQSWVSDFTYIST